MLVFIRRGLQAGALGGLAASLSLLLLGERPIKEAVTLEYARSGSGPEMFARPVQVFGGILALILVGFLVGLIFSIVFVTVRPRSRLHSDFPRALWLSAIAIGTIVVVPFLKYPANPPSVGDPNTITSRTLAYLSVLTLSIIMSVAAWGWSRRLRMRGWSDPARVAAVALGYLAVIGSAFVLLPPNPDAIEAPATLIWSFRLASLAGSVCLWGVSGFVFGWLSWRAEAAHLAADRDLIDA